MSLINCPTCTTEVSAAAAACPRCAHPIGAPIGAKPVTIEQTSKKYKKLQLWAVLAIVVGFITMFAGSANGGGASAMGYGMLFLFGGIALYIYSRVGAWWNNG